VNDPDHTGRINMLFLIDNDSENKFLPMIW
jgi:hypothetical protein